MRDDHVFIFCEGVGFMRVSVLEDVSFLKMLLLTTETPSHEVFGVCLRVAVVQRRDVNISHQSKAGG